MKRRLIVLTRIPIAGQVKTRLIPTLGAAEAAQLHRDMTNHTLRWVRFLAAQHGVQVEIHIAGGDEARAAAEFGADFAYYQQSEGDLGQRMVSACGQVLQPTVIVGTDCPGLDADTVLHAFELLNEQDVVLGPADDGGYYLIGLNSFAPELFEGISWGTSTVCGETQRLAAQSSLTVGLLATLSDVDRPEDLPVWQRVRQAVIAPQITVIIPTLNEAANLSATLTPLTECDEIEIIVVDGGSWDETCQNAAQCGALVLHSLPGRAKQMNAGAAVAYGELLLFLHADTCLPTDFRECIHATLSKPGVAAGAFRLAVDSTRYSMRLIEWGANLRSRWFQLPYGDQAFFVSKALFITAGGFPDQPLMEDVELIRRLRRHGQIETTNAAVVTSARRWNRLGIVKTTLLNQLLLVAYFLGFSPTQLAAWYRRDTKNL